MLQAVATIDGAVVEIDGEGLLSDSSCVIGLAVIDDAVASVLAGGELIVLHITDGEAIEGVLSVVCEVVLLVRSFLGDEQSVDVDYLTRAAVVLDILGAMGIDIEMPAEEAVASFDIGAECIDEDGIVMVALALVDKGQVSLTDIDDGILNAGSLVVKDQAVDTIAAVGGSEGVVVHALAGEEDIVMVAQPAVGIALTDVDGSVKEVSGVDVDDMADEGVTAIDGSTGLVVSTGGSDGPSADGEGLALAEVMTHDYLLGGRTGLDGDGDETVAAVLGVEMMEIGAGGGDDLVSERIGLAIMDVNDEGHGVVRMEMEDIVHDAIASGAADEGVGEDSIALIGDTIDDGSFTLAEMQFLAGVHGGVDGEIEAVDAVQALVGLEGVVIESGSGKATMVPYIGQVCRTYIIGVGREDILGLVETQGEFVYTIATEGRAAAIPVRARRGEDDRLSVTMPGVGVTRVDELLGSEEIFLSYGDDMADDAIASE